MEVRKKFFHTRQNLKRARVVLHENVVSKFLRKIKEPRVNQRRYQKK